MKAHPRSIALRGLVAAACAIAFSLAGAADIGQIKIANGQVSIERAGQAIPATVGMRVQPSDTVRTGADGSVGITMNDDSTLSAGPNSVFSFDRYAFDTTTNKGQFDTSLKRGSLAVISGRIAKESPDAMKVRTPAAMLGVRGTEFIVKVDD
jgi:hypothetical protein